MKRHVSFDIDFLDQLSLMELWILDNILFMEKTTGWCFSSRKKLAEYHRISYSMLHRYLTNLQDKGWVKINKKRQLKTTSKYHILVSTKVEVSTKVDAKSINKSVDGVSTKVEVVSIKKEKKVEYKAEQPEVEKIEYQNVWNDFAKDNDLSVVAKMTSSRQKKLGLRIAEIREFNKLFPAVLKKINDSRFLLGQNDRNWKISFDWLIENDLNMIKVYEGKYDE